MAYWECPRTDVEIFYSVEFLHALQPRMEANRNSVKHLFNPISQQIFNLRERGMFQSDKVPVSLISHMYVTFEYFGILDPWKPLPTDNHQCLISILCMITQTREGNIPPQQNHSLFKFDQIFKKQIDSGTEWNDDF